MNIIYNKKRGGQLSLFNNACILFILIQFIACKCGNSPSDDEGEAGGGREGTAQTTQQPEDTKLTLTLTGPAEVKNNPTNVARTIITLKLEVTNGTLNTDDYHLEAIDLKNYQQSNYTIKQTLAEDCHTKVSGTNGKTLLALIGAPTLTKNDKKDLKIPVVVTKWKSYNAGKINMITVPFSESAKFQFAILDNANNRVAGPIEVKWTRGNLIY